MARPFAIEMVTSWGMGKDNIAVMRELVRQFEALFSIKLRIHCNRQVRIAAPLLGLGGEVYFWLLTKRWMISHGRWM